MKNFAVEYNASDRTGPRPLLLRSGGVHEIPGCYSVSRRLVFLWSLAQISTLDSALYGQEKDAPQSVPDWSGFCNVAQSDQILWPSNIGHLPVIPSSPTQLPTVYILMVRSLATVDKLNQHDVVIHLKNLFTKGTKTFFLFFLFFVKETTFQVHL